MKSKSNTTEGAVVVGSGDLLGHMAKIKAWIPHRETIYDAEAHSWTPNEHTRMQNSYLRFADTATSLRQSARHLRAALAYLKAAVLEYANLKLSDCRILYRERLLR
jgi:hypothetical protein